MKSITRYLLPVLFFALATALSAAEKITLKVSEIDSLAGAIGYLDLIEREVPQGANTPPHILRGITISGITRMTLRDDLAACNVVLKPYQETKAGIIKDVADGEEQILPPTDPKDSIAKAQFDKRMKAFNAKHDPVYKKIYEVSVTKIKTADLNLDANAIPIAILDALSPILTP